MSDELNSETREIPGYGGAYRVSADGRVWSFRMKTGPCAGRQVIGADPKEIFGSDHQGYRRFFLMEPGARRARGVLAHQIVAQVFLGPCPSGMVVNHRDGNKLNNHPSNLEYTTPAENVIHAYRTGLAARGMRRKAKLTDAQVVEIRRRYLAGLATKKKGHKHPASTRSLAAEFGVSWAVLHKIVVGKMWTHLLSGPDLSWPDACPRSP